MVRLTTSLLSYTAIGLSLNAMVCSDFGEFKQYGSHYYAISGSKYTFDQAKQIAENNGGYLAIPNDTGENSFLATTFGTAWIGIYDPNYSQNLCYYGNTCTANSSRFLTVNGTAPTYTNWATGEPNNEVYQYDIVDGTQMVSPLGEHWTVIGTNGQWGSFGNHAEENNNPIQFKAIFEFDTQPECVVGGSTSESISERKCTDTIYNTGSSTTGQIINNSDGDVAMTSSNTYLCQTDSYGNEYCPTQLAKCDEVWGYQDGYSISHEICGDGTQPVNSLCKSSTKPCDTVGGTYNGSGMCVNYTYSEPTITPTVYQIGWWNCSSGCSGQFPQIRSSVSDSIWANGSATNGFYAALIMVARAAGATSWSFKTPECTEISWGDDSSCIKYNACNTTVSGRHANVSTNCLFVTDKYGDYPTEFTHNAPVQITTRDTGGGKPWYYAEATISKCQNLVLVPATKDYPSHYKCMDTSSTCSAGYTLVAEEGGGYSCRAGSAAQASCSNVSSDGYCYSTAMTYYTYHCSTETNEYGQSYSAQNTGGTGTTNPTPPTNNCKIESFSCVPSTDRKCALVGNQWQCSPFPCFGESNLESADTTVGTTDSANKGFNNDGSCSYQIRLFNGKDMRCRSWDALLGLIGGGCCQKEKGTGLGSLFGGQCKEDERLLAKYRKETQDKSHYIGEYCSKYLKLGFAKVCVQKKKTYCVFNSKLARIFHEQGRPQIGIEWGGAKAPNCKGFTPEEFQKIDFSKLDLSEFYGDLEAKITTTIDAKIGQTIQEKVESFGVNLNGK